MKVIFALLLLQFSALICFGQDNRISLKSYTNIHDGKASMYKVYFNNTYYGFSIWMNRKTNPSIKAKYFAYKYGSYSVYDRFNNWGNDKNIICLMSGAFTSDYYKPIGLTIDDGNIVNRGINYTMDGLVIVYNTGGIAVSDLDEKNLYVNNLGYLNVRNSYDKERFIDWAKNENATVFQTQLLIYKNKIKCSYQNELRERRLLVLAEDSNGDILHVVFDIDKSNGVSLYHISEIILNYFKSTNREIIAMLNLDTGMYNMFSVRSKSGKEFQTPKGTKNYEFKDVVNLVVYYYY